MARGSSDVEASLLLSVARHFSAPAVSGFRRRLWKPQLDPQFLVDRIGATGVRAHHPAQSGKGVQAHRLEADPHSGVIVANDPPLDGQPFVPGTGREVYVDRNWRTDRQRVVRVKPQPPQTQTVHPTGQNPPIPDYRHAGGVGGAGVGSSFQWMTPSRRPLFCSSASGEPAFEKNVKEGMFAQRRRVDNRRPHAIIRTGE